MLPVFFIDSAVLTSTVVLKQSEYFQKVKEFLKIASSYKDDADFIFIYVSEAHPVDGWYTASSPFSISNHQNLAERFEAAELLKGVVKDSVPIFVDNMKDEAALAYGALPERLYIVRNGSVVFEGGGGPYFYSLEKMEKSLANILRS